MRLQTQTQSCSVQPMGGILCRPYFISAIALVLTAGATWGAMLLWQIGFAGNFTGISLHHVNAHGHAQIYGWVGLFIMGFGYAIFPRFWQSPLPHPRLAIVNLVLMTLGIIVRTVGMSLPGDRLALPLTLGGGAAELLAIAIFCGQMLSTCRRSSLAWTPSFAFILTALGWFAIQSGFDLWHTAMTLSASTQEQLLWQVATYQAPLRDMQIHGMALMMILGVSLRALPHMFNLPEIATKRAWIAFACLALTVPTEVALFIAYRWSGHHALAAMLMLPWLSLAIGCVLVAWPWRLWRPVPVADPSAKFVRAAYGWLGLSLVMLLLLPVYQSISGMPFSHAYYGAIRHAITVGFVSMMIVGISSRIVPVLGSLEADQRPNLWVPFLLLNTGCFLRVSLQTLTDFHPTAFALVGISGVLEVLALASWGLPLSRMLLRPRPCWNPAAACR